MARGSTDHFRLLLHRHPHQSRLDLTPASTHAQLTFKRVQTPLTQSPSRVQTQITNSLSRPQVRFAPQGLVLRPSCLLPSQVLWFDTTYCALPHPGFVPYPIWDLWFYITYLSDTTRPSICSYYVRGSILRIFFPFFPSFFPVTLRPTCVMLSHYISSPVAFDQMTLILFTFTSSDPKHSLSLKRSDSTHHSIPKTKTRLIFPCHEGHSTPTSAFNSSGSVLSFTFKSSVSTLSITLNV